MELLSVTMNDGVVKRSELEGKDNSSEDKSNYKIVHIGDMVYNSMRMWQGANGISSYDGIVSPAYTVLTPKKEIVQSYFAALFKTNNLINEFRKNSQGLTSDTWNLKYPQISNIRISIPQCDEQTKISDFLQTLDKRIAKQHQLVKALKSYKRGALQHILSKIKTNSYLIGNIVTEYSEKSTVNQQYPILSSTMRGIKLQNAYFNKQAASEDTVGYKVVPYGYFTYRSMSDTGDFCFNYQDIIDKGIVSPAYPVFKVYDGFNSRYIEYVLNETDEIKAQLLVAKEGGTRYALSFSKFQTLNINLPTKPIQDKIEKMLLLFERQIEQAETILNTLESQKKALLQQLFI